MDEAQKSALMRTMTAAEGNRRAFEITPREEASDDPNIRRLTFTAASDEPYTRSYLFLGNVREVTDFDGLDDARLNSKRMPLLNTHRNETLDDILGTIVAHRKVSRGKSGVALEVTAEFRMDDPHSKAAYEKVKSGLVSNVSIGYTPLFPGGLESTWYDESKGFDFENDIAGDVVLKRWEILEVSLVPVPADNSIGIGRTADGSVSKAYMQALLDSKISRKDKTPSLPSTAEKTMTTKEEAPAIEEKAADEAITEAPVKEEEVREEKAKPVAKVKTAAKKREFDGTGSAYIAQNSFDLVKSGASEEFISALGEKAAEGDGLSEAAVKAELWEHIQTKDGEAMKEIGKGKAPAFHQKDARHNFFDFNRVGKLLGSKRGAEAVDGREAELVQEWSRGFDPRDPRLPARQSKEHGIMIPLSAYGEDPQMRKLINGWSTKRYDVGTGTASGHHHDIFDPAWFTEALVNQATILPHIDFMPTELAQDIVGVTESGSITTGFLQNENDQRTESAGLTFGNRKLEWKMAYGRKDFSQQALDQSQFLFGQVLNRLRRDLTRRIDEEVAIGDSNTDGGFLGIINYPSVDVIALGTNGGAMTYEAITKMIAAVEENNANAGMGKFVLTPNVKAQLRRVQRQPGATGAQSDVILSQQVGEAPNIDGFEVITSNIGGLKTLSKGTGTNLNAAMFCDFSEITGAYFSATELVVDPYSALDYGQTRVYIRLALDIQVDHVEGFSVVKDIAV